MAQNTMKIYHQAINFHGKNLTASAAPSISSQGGSYLSRIAVFEQQVMR
jgi:hypothetical protein